MSARPPSRLRRLAVYARRYTWWFVGGAIALVATNILALKIPGQIGSAVELLHTSEGNGSTVDLTAIGTIALTIAGLAIGAALSRVLSRSFIFAAGRRVEYDVRNDLFAHLLRLSPADYEKSSTGDLVSRIINDVTQIRLLFGVGALNLVNTTFAYIIVLGFMFELSPKLTLWALAPYPFVLWIMRWFTRQLYQRTVSAQEAVSDVTSQAQEALSGAAVVQSFVMENHTSDAFGRASHAYAERNVAVARIRGGLMPFMRMVGSLGTLIVIVFGGRAVLDGTLTLGQFVEFSGYVVMLAWPTMALSWVLSVWSRGTAAFERSCQVLDTEPSVGEPHTAIPLPQHGDICFEDVSLTYPDGTVALSDISLRIQAGATVAVVGPTGSGKSSLVELITRLRDPSAGRITYGDVDLRDAALDDVRARMSYAPQEGFLFSMSLADNIALGSERDDEAIARATKIAHLTGDLSAFSEGLDTWVGERGVTVSGGQRHRSTIARAVYADADVLLLDDALASVDTETERAILGELGGVLKDRTSVLVTHRFNALDLVDAIYVLEDGRLIESGTHDELTERGGRYAEMVERQQLEAGLE
ncbi:MAG: ATP-binding cassette subfamily B multidrug efflux pump [Bradymonadia bacterium]